MRVVLVSLAFNVFWFAAALGQSASVPFLAFALLMAVFLDRKVLLGSAVIAAAGLSGDALLAHLGFISFNQAPYPLWFVLLWVGFGAYVWLLREWLQEKTTILLLVVGALGGAMSYLAGDRLGALTLPQAFWTTFSVLSFAWLCYSAAILAFINYFAKKESLWPLKQSLKRSESPRGH